MATRSPKAGSLLILALWIMVLLSLFALSVGYSVDQKIRVARKLEVRGILSDVAVSSVAKVQAAIHNKDLDAYPYDTTADSWNLNPEIFQKAAVGRGTFTIARDLDRYLEWIDETEEPFGGELIYGLEDEESKIHLNQFGSRIILIRLFESAAGVSRGDAVSMADSLMDFMDADDHINASGAEKKYYQSLPVRYLPKDAPLDRLDELLYIKGFTTEIYKRIIPYTTLWSSGKVNINTASSVVLKALGFTDQLVEKIMNYKNGKDRILYTSDDGYFRSTDEITARLLEDSALSEKEQSLIAEIVNSGVLTVRSSGFRAHVLTRVPARSEALRIDYVINRNGDVLYWNEKFISLRKEVL